MHPMFDRILCNRSWPADRPALIGPGSTATWGDLADLAGSLGPDEPGLARCRVGIVFHPNPSCLAALAVLDRLECDAFLMDGRLTRRGSGPTGARSCN